MSSSWESFANLFQLFVMPPNSFVQRLVNYSTSCRLIREWISISRRYGGKIVGEIGSTKLDTNEAL